MLTKVLQPVCWREDRQTMFVGSWDGRHPDQKLLFEPIEKRLFGKSAGNFLCRHS